MPPPPHELSASAAARLIRERRLSAEALVADCLARIGARDAQVRAWAHVDGDAALAQARALDRQAPLGPLHGVPVGIKDVIDVAGMPVEFNSPIYRDCRPRADAAAVALLRRAGCVILGKTHTAEFAYAHPPPTRNPRNGAHTPGGSSSGSAAAVADRMVPLALGTQTGGSTIRPAAFCGTIGFKPSFGSINRAGVKPVAESLDTVGLFANVVDDVALALQILSGRAAPDFGAALAAPRIGLARTGRWDDAEPCMRAALEAAAQRLSAAGAALRDVELPSQAEALFDMHEDIMTFEAARALGWEHAMRREELSPALLARLEQGRALPREQYDRARLTARDARRAFSDLMGEYDLLLMPSAPGEAPEGLASTGNSLFNRVPTLLGVPCINLPFGAGPRGLPLGVQLVAAFDEDAALLARAQRIAEVLGGQRARW